MIFRIGMMNTNAESEFSELENYQNLNKAIKISREANEMTFVLIRVRIRARVFFIIAENNSS